MAEIHRTLLKSPPELWELLDDEPLMRGWLEQLTATEVAEVEVEAREPERFLRFTPAAASGFRGARIEVLLEEKGFGTRISVRTEFEADGWIPSARAAAEEQAEARMSSLLDAAVEEMATPQKRPFTAA